MLFFKFNRFLSVISFGSTIPFSAEDVNGSFFFASLCSNSHGMSSFLSLVEQYDQRTLRNNEILAAFEKESGYEIVQSNGQRICGPPPELKSKRVLLKGTEVFIGKLPRDCLENEIFLFCSRAGQIYQMRLMVNFSGDNRGYCFVKYCTFQAAYNAVSILNNTYIRPGHRVGVALSSDNTRLQVLCINPTVTNEAISQVSTFQITSYWYNFRN